MSRNFLGVDEKLDKIFSSMMSDDNIKNSLLKILGKNYKINTCTIRAADCKSKYLGLHTDNDFQFTLSVLCNKVNKTDTTTVFLPKSHRFNYSFKNEIEKINPFYFKWFLEPSFGEVGDIVAFFNKTLHGVQSNKRQEKNL